MSTGHSVFSPSSYSMWSKCPPSIYGNISNHDAPPEPFNPHSALGTLAHEVGEVILRGGDINKIVPCKELQEMGVKVDEEMVEYVSIYTNFVKSLKGTLYVETRVNLEYIHPDFGGTADAIVVSEDGKHIHVVDLKYGTGVQVFAVNNPQLMIYALGAIYTLGIVSFETISVTIAQPRLDHLDTFTLTYDELLKFETEVISAVRAAEIIIDKGTAPLSAFNPSEDTCRWCKMRLSCKPLKDKALNYVRDMFDSYGEEDETSDETGIPGSVATPQPEMLPDEDLDSTLSYIWKSEKLLAIVRKAYEAEAFKRLSEGKDLTSFKIVASNPNRKWAESPALLEKMSNLLGKEAFTTKLISPAQAEKLLKKDKIALEAIAAHIDRGEPKPALATISDKRNRFTGSTGRISAADFDDFDDVDDVDFE